MAIKVVETKNEKEAYMKVSSVKKESDAYIKLIRVNDMNDETIKIFIDNSKINNPIKAFVVDKVDNDVETLSKSLIYKMSLGSKELYHSNIWAWLINQDKNFIKIFIDNIDLELTFIYCTREEKNRDLTLWFKDKFDNWKCYVIENKLKSIPYKEQLKKYTGELKDELICGILTGLKKPNIMNGNDTILINDKKWKFVSYSTISSRIKKLVEESSVESIKNNKGIILEYVKNNEIVEKIVNEHIFENKLIQIWDHDLNELGLSDLTNKIIGSLFVNYVKRRLEEDNLHYEDFYIAEGFHNKKITLDFRFKIENKIDIGIQIEAYQYRRIIDIKDVKYGEPIMQESILESYCDFLDINFNGKEKIIKFPNDISLERNTSQTKTLCRYGNNVIYQYSNLENDDLDFEKLYQRIKNDLNLVEKILK